MPRNSTNVSTKQRRIAELAKQSPQMAFTSLAYLMDIDWLKEAYRRNRKRTMGWIAFQCLIQRYPLAPVRTVHSVIARTVNP